MSSNVDSYDSSDDSDPEEIELSDEATPPDLQDAIDQASKALAKAVARRGLPIGWPTPRDNLIKILGKQYLDAALDQNRVTQLSVGEAAAAAGRLSLERHNDSVKSLGSHVEVSERLVRARITDLVDRLNKVTTLSYLSQEDREELLRRQLDRDRIAKPRKSRGPADFFEPFETIVRSRDELIEAISQLQRKNGHLGLIWRGQEDSAWAIESSLTRHLRKAEHPFDEDSLIAFEEFQFSSGLEWGMMSTNGELAFLAELQHAGAPTWLIDVSLDPDVALWFATRDAMTTSQADARLVVWARTRPARKGVTPLQAAEVQPYDSRAFWHDFTTPDMRSAAHWGTGRVLHAWDPPPTVERMRAQRAAFVFDTYPVVDGVLLELIRERLGADWKSSEIAQSTRILGVPTRIDTKAVHNRADAIPMFSIRIASKAKAEIREHLKWKGLTEKFIFPDFGGLVEYLRRGSTFPTRP